MFGTSDRRYRRARTIVRLFSFHIPLSLSFSFSLFLLAYLTRDTSVDALRSPVSAQPRTVYSRFIAIRVPLRETRGIDDETLSQSSITTSRSETYIYTRIYLSITGTTNCAPCCVQHTESTDGKSIKRQPKPTNLEHVSHRRLEHLTERSVSKSTATHRASPFFLKFARFFVFSFRSIDK